MEDIMDLLDKVLEDKRCFIAYHSDNYLFTADASGYHLTTVYEDIDCESMDEVRDFLIFQYNEMEKLPYFDEIVAEIENDLEVEL